MRYLSAEDIMAIHDEMLARFGGTKGVRDVNALSSAVGRLHTAIMVMLLKKRLLCSRVSPKTIRSLMETREQRSRPRPFS